MPWEVYFSTSLNVKGKYWLITKAGSMPGYVSVMLMIPQLKFGVITQMTGGNIFTVVASAVSILLPAFEDALTRYALPPPRPNNITQFAGIYLADYLLGFVTTNVTVQVVGSTLNISFAIGGGIASGVMLLNATWVGGNTFRLHVLQKDLPCLDVQAGLNDLFLYFHTSYWTGEIYSLTMPGTLPPIPPALTHLSLGSDPFYGWTFYKQGS